MSQGTYTTSFTLTQDEEGNIYSSLSMDPEPEAGKDILVYEQMAYLAQVYLMSIGVMDADGNRVEIEGNPFVAVEITDQEKH